MRCEIAASPAAQSQNSLLDEPTIGPDAVSKIAVREFIRRLNREHGTTVISPRNDMQDIEALTQRILLIGKALSCWTAAQRNPPPLCRRKNADGLLQWRSASGVDRSSLVSVASDPRAGRAGLRPAGPTSRDHHGFPPSFLSGPLRSG